MNWRQLFSSATREERDDLEIFFKALEVHQGKRLLVKSWLGFERRRLQAAHFINERRGRSTRRPVLATFIFIICTMTIASWAIAITAEPEVGAPILGLNLAFLYLILMWKPYRKSAG